MTADSEKKFLHPYSCLVVLSQNKRFIRFYLGWVEGQFIVLFDEQFTAPKPNNRQDVGFRLGMERF